MSKLLPFFTSEYSIGESILTLKPQGKSKPTGPQSILDIAPRLGLNHIFLVENSMAGFISAYNNTKQAKLQLCFGLKLVICQDVKNKSEESRNTESKVIVFLRNSAGYSNLVKIWNRAATDNFYYYPRVDSNLLQQFWDNNQFFLYFPFYSSFLAQNTLKLYECIVDYQFTQPVFTLEDSDLPFDYILKNKVEEYAKTNNLETQKVRSIYYEKYEDILAYSTYKCIKNRSTLDKPELSHFSSNRFCAEDYANSIKNLC